MGLIVQIIIDSMPQENLTKAKHQQLSALLSSCYIRLWLHTSFLIDFSIQRGCTQPVVLHAYTVYLFGFISCSAPR